MLLSVCCTDQSTLDLFNFCCLLSLCVCVCVLDTFFGLALLLLFLLGLGLLISFDARVSIPSRVCECVRLLTAFCHVLLMDIGSWPGFSLVHKLLSLSPSLSLWTWAGQKFSFVFARAALMITLRTCFILSSCVKTIDINIRA